MIKHLCVLFSFLVLFIFRPCFGDDYCKMADKIINSYIKEVAKPRGLRVTASGGAMMNDVEKVILKFMSFDALTVDQARNLYVEMVEELLFRFNTNEKIRPYLQNYPFQANNFDLMISFEDKQLRRRGEGLVALVFRTNKQNKLFIEGYNLNIGKFYILHEEPYEESVRIVHESREAKKS